MENVTSTDMMPVTVLDNTFYTSLKQHMESKHTNLYPRGYRHFLVILSRAPTEFSATVNMQNQLSFMLIENVTNTDYDGH